MAVAAIASTATSCNKENKQESTDKKAAELAEVNAGKLFGIASGYFVVKNEMTGGTDTIRFAQNGKKLMKSQPNSPRYRFINTYNESTKQYDSYTVNDKEKEYIADSETPVKVLNGNYGLLVESLKAEGCTVLKDTTICGKTCHGMQIQTTQLVNTYYYDRIEMSSKSVLKDKTSNIDEYVVEMKECAIEDSYFTIGSDYKKL